MKHGMKQVRKRPSSFYSWLNGTVFHKNLGLMKLSYDDKRITECVDHRLKRKEKPFFKAPETHKRTQRDK